VSRQPRCHRSPPSSCLPWHPTLCQPNSCYANRGSCSSISRNSPCRAPQCRAPSVVPTVTTGVPSSVLPTVAPIDQPTVAQSLSPTMALSLLPALVSSSLPTRQPPSALPTVAPRVLPTVDPKFRPIVAPVDMPTVAPSVSPTVAPDDVSPVALNVPGGSARVLPTASPSVLPTMASSLVTTVVVVPSTELPIYAPHVSPTVVPNVVPTPIPRVAPSGTPSSPPARPLLLETLETKFRPKRKTAPTGRSLSPTSVCWMPPTLPEPEELDHLIQEASQLFSESSTWNEFVPKVRDVRGDFHPNVGKVPNPAAHLLNHFKIGGAPVACSGTPWYFAQKAAALTCGPHQSARQHVPFLRQEFVDMIRKG
jgi:hypothetical protein